MEPEAPVRGTVTLFHVADVHSHLFPRRLAVGARDAALGLGREGTTALVGGSARLGALLSRERARAATSFFLDAGDVLEGTSVFSLFHGVPEMLTAEALGLDAAAAGNHDLSRGGLALAALRTGRVSFPLLAANLPDLLESGVAVPSTVLERNGVRLLVVGLGRAPDGPVDLDASAAAVERAVAGGAPTADAVVVLSHLGRDLDLELVPKTSGIDVILGGHTHDVLEPPASVMDCGPAAKARLGCEPRPVLVAHPGAYGRYLGRLDLRMSSDPADVSARRAATRSVVLDSEFTLLPVNDALPEDARTAALLAPYADALVQAGFEKPFAFAPAAVSRRQPLAGDSALGNVVARAMRLAARADLAVINATGIRSDLLAGDLTLDDFFEILPFDDALVTLGVSGADLERAFSDIASDSCARARESQAEIDGGAVVFGCDPRPGATLSIAGKSVETGSVYRVATVSFLVERGQWLSGRGTVVGHGPPVRDVVIAAARNAEPCSGDAGNRLPCLDAAMGAQTDGRISWH